MFIGSRGDIARFVETSPFEAGKVYTLTLPYAEGCEDQANQIRLVCLDGRNVAIRLEQYAFDWDWGIVPVRDLEGVLNEFFTMNENELADLRLQKEAKDWDNRFLL